VQEEQAKLISVRVQNLFQSYPHKMCTSSDSENPATPRRPPPQRNAPVVMIFSRRLAPRRRRRPPLAPSWRLRPACRTAPRFGSPRLARERARTGTCGRAGGTAPVVSWRRPHQRKINSRLRVGLGVAWGWLGGGRPDAVSDTRTYLLRACSTPSKS